MAAVYPTAVKTFNPRQNYTEIVDAGDVNQAYDEISALETVLGPMPQQDTLDNQLKTWPNVKASIASSRRGLTDPIVRLTANNIKVPYAASYFPSYTSKQVDTHGAWTGGPIIQSPRTGWYTIAAYIRWHKDGATVAADVPKYDHSGKLQLGISPATDQTFLTCETHYYPSGWQEFTRHSCSILTYWPKGQGVRVNLWNHVVQKTSMISTVIFTAVYHRDPPTTGNM